MIGVCRSIAESLQWLLSPLLLISEETDSPCQSVTVSPDSLHVTIVCLHIQLYLTSKMAPVLLPVVSLRSDTALYEL